MGQGDVSTVAVGNEVLGETNYNPKVYPYTKAVHPDQGSTTLVKVLAESVKILF